MNIALTLTVDELQYLRALVQAERDFDEESRHLAEEFSECADDVLDKLEGGAVMNRPRKDYGAPVRVWYDEEWLGLYTAMPPRSARAARDWRHDDGTWECVEVPRRSCIRRMAAYAPGPHLGRRVAWGDIPPAVQAQLRASFLGEYCPKGEA